MRIASALLTGGILGWLACRAWAVRRRHDRITDELGALRRVVRRTCAVDGTRKRAVSDERVDLSTKICSKCQVPKPQPDFYVDRRAKDGLTSACKQCVTAQRMATKKAHPTRQRDYNRIYKQRHAESVRQRARAAYLSDPAKWQTRLQLLRSRAPEIPRAQAAVARAVRRGILIRPESCGHCGASGRIEASHSDYSRPLDVEWLCVSCHRRKDHRVYRSA